MATKTMGTISTLGWLVDSGATIATIKSNLKHLIENNQCEGDDDLRCCIALAWYLGQGNDCHPEMVEHLWDDYVKIDGMEYRVLTEEEAKEAGADYVRETLWAFRPSFLASETGIDEMVFDLLVSHSEDANDALRAIIVGSCGLDNFIENAVCEDGRGSFLSCYDGCEEEFYSGGDYWYLYRTN
jgi:hypothetical protein